MKIKLLTLSLVLTLLACSSSESIFILEPSQSMLMTGKGPGQDGAINPYSDGKSIAIVKNLGESSVDARIQKQGEIIEVAPADKKKIVLDKGYELYFDSQQDAKIRLLFRDGQ